MKIAKRLLPFLLIIFAVLGIGCAFQNKTAIEKVIKKELDLLKNLDSNTAQKYISYKELFPGVTEDSTMITNINEVFSLYFQDFNYKILDVNVDKENQTATADIRLTTLDAQELARDFAASRLEFLLLNSAVSDSNNTEDMSFSLEDCYHILYDLLTNKEYKTTENKCTIELTENKQNDSWEIISTSAFENELVGGLSTYLSNTDLLSPEDTLSVYFQTLQNMNIDEMGAFLGVESILNSADTVKKDIAYALAEQVHKTFNYDIITCASEAYTATIKVEITTFDSDAILTSYEEELEKYLSTPDAVIDGSTARYEKSVSLLLDKIKNNTDTITTTTILDLVNDGISWKLEDNGKKLGEVIFGTLSSDPVNKN